MDQKSIEPRLNAFGHYSINMDVPLLVTLQHCWEAFIVFLPIASLAIVAYVTITLDKK